MHAPMNSSAKTVVFDSSWTQSIAMVGVSAMNTRLKLLATLKMKRKTFDELKAAKILISSFYLSSVSSTMNLTLSLESSVMVTEGWLANGIATLL